MHIKVRAKTGAKNESLREISEDHFEMCVREKPQHNFANRRIVELIAAHYRLPVANVRIIKGHHRASKIIVLDFGP